MCILSMREMGGVHKTICQVPKMQENEILQQGVPEECLGFPPPLVCCCNSVTAPPVPSWALTHAGERKTTFPTSICQTSHDYITSHWNSEHASKGRWNEAVPFTFSTLYHRPTNVDTKWNYSCISGAFIQGQIAFRYLCCRYFLCAFIRFSNPDHATEIESTSQYMRGLTGWRLFVSNNHGLRTAFVFCFGAGLGVVLRIESNCRAEDGYEISTTQVGRLGGNRKEIGLKKRNSR